MDLTYSTLPFDGCLGHIFPLNTCPVAPTMDIPGPES